MDTQGDREMSELCHHAWVGDDECAYCKSEELEGLLSECMTRIAELEDKIAKLQWQLSYRDDNDLSLRYGNEEDLR